MEGCFLPSSTRGSSTRTKAISLRLYAVTRAWNAGKWTNLPSFYFSCGTQNLELLSNRCLLGTGFPPCNIYHTFSLQRNGNSAVHLVFLEVGTSCSRCDSWSSWAVEVSEHGLICTRLLWAELSRQLANELKPRGLCKKCSARSCNSASSLEQEGKATSLLLSQGPDKN